MSHHSAPASHTTSQPTQSAQAHLFYPDSTPNPFGPNLPRHSSLAAPGSQPPSSGSHPVPQVSNSRSDPGGYATGGSGGQDGVIKLVQTLGGRIFTVLMMARGYLWYNPRNPDPTNTFLAKQALQLANNKPGGGHYLDKCPDLTPTIMDHFAEVIQTQRDRLEAIVDDLLLVFHQITMVTELIKVFGFSREVAVMLCSKLLILTLDDIEPMRNFFRQYLYWDFPAAETPKMFAFTDGVDGEGDTYLFNSELCKAALQEFLFVGEDALSKWFPITSATDVEPTYLTPCLDGFQALVLLAAYKLILSFCTGRQRRLELSENIFGETLSVFRNLFTQTRRTRDGNAALIALQSSWWWDGLESHCFTDPHRQLLAKHVSSGHNTVSSGRITKTFGLSRDRTVTITDILSNARPPADRNAIAARGASAKTSDFLSLPAILASISDSEPPPSESCSASTSTQKTTSTQTRMKMPKWIFPTPPPSHSRLYQGVLWPISFSDPVLPKLLLKDVQPPPPKVLPPRLPPQPLLPPVHSGPYVWPPPPQPPASYPPPPAPQHVGVQHAQPAPQPSGSHSVPPGSHPAGPSSSGGVSFQLTSVESMSRKVLDSYGSSSSATSNAPVLPLMPHTDSHPLTPDPRPSSSAMTRSWSSPLPASGVAGTSALPDLEAAEYIFNIIKNYVDRNEDLGLGLGVEGTAPYGEGERASGEYGESGEEEGESDKNHKGQTYKGKGKGKEKDNERGNGNGNGRRKGKGKEREKEKEKEKNKGKGKQKQMQKKRGKGKKKDSQMPMDEVEDEDIMMMYIDFGDSS